MSVTNTTAKLVAAAIMRGLEDNLIANRICQNQYSGEIEHQGDSVIFPYLAEPTVNNYSGTVTYEELEDAAITLNVDQAKYVAFKVGNIDALQTSIDLKGSQAERAVYRLRREIDKYVLGLYAQAGTTLSDVSITSQNVISTLSTMAQKLEEKNVNSEGIWLAVPPFVKKYLRDAGVRMQINNGINGKGGLFWTNELGFDLFVTNNLSVVSNKTKVLGGSYNAIAFAGQMVENENIRLENSFDDAFRALYVFGAKVIKPQELICVGVAEGEDSGI